MIVRAERHTGSHFLSAVLRHIFPKEHNSIHAEPIMHSSDCPVSQPYAQQASCCWKHGFPEYDCTWCASMGMSLENMSISEFIRRPYLQTDSNTALIARNNYSNPIQMWNDKTRSFLRVERPKVILRQEELFDIEALQRKLPPLAEYGFSMASTKVSFPPLNEEKSIRGEEVNSPLE